MSSFQLRPVDLGAMRRGLVVPAVGCAVCSSRDDRTSALQRRVPRETGASAATTGCLSSRPAIQTSQFSFLKGIKKQPRAYKNDQEAAIAIKEQDLGKNAGQQSGVDVKKQQSEEGSQQAKDARRQDE